MKQFLLYCCLFFFFAACTKSADAQDSCTSHNAKKKDWVVGYSAGEQMLLGNNAAPANKYAFTNTVSGKKYIDDRWAVEFELNLSVVTRQPSGNEVTIINEGICKEYNVSLPVTVEYNFLPKDSKLKPYIGAGMQYNVSQEKYSEYDFYEGFAKKVTSTRTNSPYASFVITQGVTYDISPRIQIKESIHFLPQINTHSAAIGASIGIGFKF